MKTRDITLASSLMGWYIAIIITETVLPVKVSTLMVSALCGLFWSYFSTLQNLTFQGLRLGYQATLMISSLPRLTAIMRGQSFIGLTFLDWVDSIGFGIHLHNEGYQLLEVTATAQPTIILYFIFLVYAAVSFFIGSYAFYRIFKRMGIFKRLPVF